MFLRNRYYENSTVVPRIAWGGESGCEKKNRHSNCFGVRVALEASWCITQNNVTDEATILHIAICLHDMLYDVCAAK